MAYLFEDALGSLLESSKKKSTWVEAWAAADGKGGKNRARFPGRPERFVVYYRAASPPSDALRAHCERIVSALRAHCERVWVRTGSVLGAVWGRSGGVPGAFWEQSKSILSAF